MTLPLPKWEMRKYALLWNKFKDANFTNKEAQDLLKEKELHLLSVLFYDLSRMGWIEIERDKEDQRKKVYRLKEPNQAVKEIAKEKQRLL